MQEYVNSYSYLNTNKLTEKNDRLQIFRIVLSNFKGISLSSLLIS